MRISEDAYVEVCCGSLEYGQEEDYVYEDAKKWLDRRSPEFHERLNRRLVDRFEAALKALPGLD